MIPMMEMVVVMMTIMHYDDANDGRMEKTTKI